MSTNEPVNPCSDDGNGKHHMMFAFWPYPAYFHVCKICCEGRPGFKATHSMRNLLYIVALPMTLHDLHVQQAYHCKLGSLPYTTKWCCQLSRCLLLSLFIFRSAIGAVVALLSHDQMIAYGMRGKGFRTLHLYGDHLW